MADEPVTLREAAQLAGISTHAMRMRYRRSVKAGEPIGFKDKGVVKIKLVDGAVPDPKPRGTPHVTPNVTPSQPVTPRESAEFVPDADNPPPEPGPTPEELQLEYQAIELKRLKQELAEAKDQIGEERRRYDQLQADWRTDREREQVLRQDLQRLMGKLEARLALAAPETDRIDQLEQDNRDLKTGVVSLVEYISEKRGR
jgi:hypothetical protein